MVFNVVFDVVFDVVFNVVFDVQLSKLHIGRVYMTTNCFCQEPDHCRLLHRTRRPFVCFVYIARGLSTHYSEFGPGLIFLIFTKSSLESSCINNRGSYFFRLETIPSDI